MDDLLGRLTWREKAMMHAAPAIERLESAYNWWNEVLRRSAYPAIPLPIRDMHSRYLEYEFA